MDLAPAQTTATSTPTKLNIPEKANRVKIVHVTSGEIVWIGNTPDITANGTNVWPLIQDTYINLDLQIGNDNAVYIVTDGNNIKVFALGEVKE